MKLIARIVGLGALAALLAVPAIALAAQPRSGAFTSTKADIHVSKGGATIHDAEINCKQASGGLTIQAIDFGTPIPVKSTGRFVYHGSANFVSFTGSGYKSRPATASLRGEFDTAKTVRGTVTGGPKSCSSVTFTATYNPRAH